MPYNPTAYSAIAPSPALHTKEPSAQPAQEDTQQLAPALSFPQPTPPIDIVSELGVNIAAVPYRPLDPVGWVRDLANVYWQPVESVLKKAISLQPGIDFRSLPNCTQQRTWCRYDVRLQQWVECGPEGLPRLLVPDVESIREGKETPTSIDHYRPFLCTALGMNAGDSHMSWYCWRDHMNTGDPLAHLLPFPADRIVINHNVTAYDRRYFSCEYAQIGPSTNVYLDTRSLSIMMHGISDQADAIYKSMKNAQADGAGVPVWVTKASRSSLADMVEFKLGERINKTVRQDFTSYTAAELAQHMYDADNLAITPLSVHTYCAQDVHYTWELFRSLFAEADARFITHPASWSGLGLLGNMRVYLEDFDSFIARSDAEYQKVLEEQILGVVRRLSERALDVLCKCKADITYTKINSNLIRAQRHLARFEHERKQCKQEIENLTEEQNKLSPKLGKLALQIEIARSHTEKLKAKKKESKDFSADDESLLDDLKKELTKHRASYRKASADWHEAQGSGQTSLLSSQDKQSPAARLIEKLSRAKVQHDEARAKAKKLKEFIAEQKPLLEIAESDRLAAATAENPHLDWALFSNGDRAGQVKWLAKLEEKGFSIGTNDAITLFDFHWRGEPVSYQLNCAHDGDSTGTWVAGGEKLPHLGGGENLGSPICLDYYRFVVSGELTSPHLTQEELKRLFKAVENTGQWRSYQKRYKGIYREDTAWGTLTTTDGLPGGTISGRVTGATSMVLPGESDKIGSSVQRCLNPGKGRVKVYEDFAAQESKFLAMLVNCWDGREFSTPWSEAVLKGEKSKRTDIHNLVADYCSEEDFTVNRTAGKKLNFTSIYMCGEEKLASTLIKHFEYPEDRAIAVATKFMSYLKGQDGIAVQEFAMLTRCANLPGFRTPALGRKIADSVDFNYCPKDFHTTRANWTIQSGCVDLLHIVTTVVWAMCWEYEIDAFLLLTVHDSLQYSVAPKDEDLFRRVFDFAHAVAKQCAYQGATAWARKAQGCEEIPSLWCPRTDIYFEAG